MLAEREKVQPIVELLVHVARRDGAITAVQHLPAQPPTYADWPEDVLSARLIEAVRKRGIERPYVHQADAVRHALARRNAVVVTPTASGKTLCYNLPVLETWLRNRDARALYLFPTKALSQDQLNELQTLADVLEEPLKAFTYDGDTADDARRAIRSQAHVVVTNPDMLHSGILPHHARWARLFENLQYVVIDEVHTYRGVFGSHLCNVIRRLKRIAAFYGASPTFIMSSATIANPQELASRLIELPVELVDNNGAPRGEKAFVFYNPPVINPELGIRRSCVNQARWIASRFLKSGVQTIAFATSRLNVEVLTKYLKDDLERAPHEKGRIRAYRGGYLPNTRREIEKGLRDGDILGVVSTNALELGIDIGHLDAAVLAGYPGSIASTWQQAGRAGRRSGQSVVVLVARSDPMDQFIINHPEYFFERSPEHALINPDNLLILVNHVKCAAFELPFTPEERFGAENLHEILDYLVEEKVLHKSGGAWHWALDVYPADGVSLRTISTENFVIMDATRDNRVIAEVDYHSAPTTVYQDAIYMCETQTYNVKHIDYAQRRVYVKKVDADYYTEAITNTSVKILEVFETSIGHSLALPAGTDRAEPDPDPALAVKGHGDVHVAWRVSGFKKIKFSTRENVGYGEVNLPDQEMHTTSYWVTLPHPLLARLTEYGRSEILDGVSGLAYVLHHVAPIFLMCDPSDVSHCVGDHNGRWFVQGVRDHQGRVTVAPAEAPAPTILESGMRLPDAVPTETYLDSLDRFEPTIFLYDTYPGGIGFSAPLYDAHRTLLERAREMLEACGCAQGCPSCVGPVIEVGARSKEVAARLVTELLA